jgi:lysophospholipase L1-like esterase
MTPVTEANDPLCLAPQQAAALLQDAPWRRFAVVGDSLSAGIGDQSPGYSDLGWADRVADALRRGRPELAYENSAVIGATTAQTLQGLEETLARFVPDLLHIPSGANDLVAPVPDYAAIERGLSAVFGLAADTGATVTAFTLGRAYVMPKFGDWRERVLRVNDITRHLAAEHDVVLVDMWAHPVNMRPNLLSADGIHFSTSGQAVMASEIVKGLAERLAATTGAPA